jgi:hypothetical protein
VRRKRRREKVGVGEGKLQYCGIPFFSLSLPPPFPYLTLFFTEKKKKAFKKYYIIFLILL